MSNYNQISSFIWNVCDDVLRGLFKPHEYGDVILPFTVLRRLDCILEPHKDDMFNIYEEYKSKVDDPTPIILNKINTTLPILFLHKLAVEIIEKLCSNNLCFFLNK